LIGPHGAAVLGMKDPIGQLHLAWIFPVLPSAYSRRYGQILSMQIAIQQKKNRGGFVVRAESSGFCIHHMEFETSSEQASFVQRPNCRITPTDAILPKVVDRERTKYLKRATYSIPLRLISKSKHNGRPFRKETTRKDYQDASANETKKNSTTVLA
jgi:hypothetical protein